MSNGLKKFGSKQKTFVPPLKPEDHVVQPVVDVSPPKWHLGHTTWFFEQFLLKDFQADYQVFHPRYAFLFNSYYEGAGERVNRSYRGNMTRPSVAEILEYRSYVNDQMLAFLQHPKAKPERIWTILELGLQHEQQHQELLMYDIKYILGHNPLFPVYVEEAGARGWESGVGPKGKDPSTSLRAGENYLEVEGGVYSVGHDGNGFHFDNERGKHKVYVEPYRILDRLITNGEFIEFIEAGGYKDFRYWLYEGWHWVNNNQVDTPFYWFNIDGDWHHYTLQGLRKVDPEEPMTHINYYEADAFAKWKGKRLPTEFEWEIACNQYAPSPTDEANFVESGAFRPVSRKEGNYQFWGDAWEWTQSAYLPYPYFNIEPGPIGEYNGKFMVNQMVLRGGSCATPKNHIRSTYRNFFHPHLQWLFTGIRLAENC